MDPLIKRRIHLLKEVVAKFALEVKFHDFFVDQTNEKSADLAYTQEA
jgi:hypothetical protein